MSIVTATDLLVDIGAARSRTALLDSDERLGGDVRLGHIEGYLKNAARIARDLRSDSEQENYRPKR